MEPWAVFEGGFSQLTGQARGQCITVTEQVTIFSGQITIT